MASFSQFRVSFAKDKGVRQITWVCGPEQVLIEDVVSSIKKRLNVAPWNYVPLVVGMDSERTVWAEIDQHPLDSGPRLVIIRNAERLKDWNRLIEFIKYRSMNPLTHIIFVSNDERSPRVAVAPAGKFQKATEEATPYIAAFSGKGYVIECKPYTAATVPHAVEWVKSKVKMRDGIAGYMLNRANGDLRLVRDMCTKLAVFPDEITLTTINLMLKERPRDSFSDALLALDKKTALLALRDLSPSDYSRTLGFLDARLDLAGMVHDMQMDHKTPSEMAMAAGNQNFLVKDIIPIAKHYDHKRRLQIRKTLALADDALRSGATEAVMESIVAFW